MGRHVGFLYHIEVHVELRALRGQCEEIQTNNYPKIHFVEARYRGQNLFS